MRLLLLGCTGLVGRELVPQLLAAGHTLTVVSRQQRQIAGVLAFKLILAARGWTAGSARGDEQAEGVVNLAGEPIAEQRWTCPSRGSASQPHRYDQAFGGGD